MGCGVLPCPSGSRADTESADSSSCEQEMLVRMCTCLLSVRSRVKSTSSDGLRQTGGFLFVRASRMFGCACVRMYVYACVCARAKWHDVGRFISEGFGDDDDVCVCFHERARARDCACIRFVVHVQFMFMVREVMR